MKSKILPFLLLCSVIFGLSSCLGDDEYVTYSDTAITSFSLSTQKWVKDTVASTGEDSTYETTLDCSSYQFYIDQSQGLIYNADSLPKGIDIEKIVCSANSKNSGVILIKDTDSDTLNYLSTQDSVDFSEPRVLRVYNSSGIYYRDYTVTVNVHQENPDEFEWQQATTYSSFASLTSMKGVACGGNVYVFGIDGTSTKVFATSETDPEGWQQLSTNVSFSTDAYKSAVVQGDSLYIYDNGSVYLSTDGATWNAVSDVSGLSLQQLVGATASHLYATTTDGKILCSTDHGITWTENTLDSDGSLLPTENVNFAYKALATNVNTYKLFLCGTSSTDALCWGKVEENDEYAQEQDWAYYTVSADNTHLTPNLENLQVVNYGGNMLAMGGAGLGNYTAEAFEYVYMSEDGGLTWYVNDLYTLPDDFSSSETSFTMLCDSQNFLWIVCGSTGQVWRGRLTQLGWSTEQTYFD